MKYIPRFLSIAAAICLLGASAHADNGPYSGGGPYSGNAKSNTGSSITLTTTGSGGASTLVGSSLNIPVYAGSGASATPLGSLQISTSGSNFGALQNSTSSQSALVGLVGQPPYYVANYGVKADGKTLLDVTTTAGSATVTSTGTQFVAGDVGKMVSINAGTSVTTTGTTVNNSNILSSLTTVGGVAIGQSVIGTGIPAGDSVLDVSTSTSVVMTMPATASNTESLTFVNPLNATISGVSGGNAILSATTSTNIAGVGRMVYGTNDIVALQSADTAASNAGGGTLELPQGMIITNNSLILDSNVSLNGLGAGKSIIKWVSTGMQAGNPIVESRTQANGVTLGNCSTGGYANQKYNQMTNFEIDALSATETSYNVSDKGIGFACSQNSVVDHVYVHDTLATGIATDSGFPTQVSNNIVVNAGRFGGGQGFNGSNNIGGSNGIGEGAGSTGKDSYIITGNYIYNQAHFAAFVETELPNTTVGATAIISNNIVVEGGNTQSLNDIGLLTIPTGGAIGNSGISNFTATGNVIYGNAATTNPPGGIYTDNGTFQTGASGTNTVITGNSIYNVGGAGVEINYANYVPSGSMASKVIISGNQILSGGSEGIKLIPYTSGSIDTVLITGNIISLNGDAGIRAADASGTGGITNLTISNNTISNNGVTTATDYHKSGVALAVSVTGFTMTGNSIFDNASSTQKYGLITTTSGNIVNALIANNNITAPTVSNAYSISGTLTATSGISTYIAGTMSITDGYGANKALVLSSTTFTPDLNAGQNYLAALTTGCVCGIANPTNIATAVGQSGVIEIDQPLAATTTVTWGSNYKFAGGSSPVLSTTTGAGDFFSYYVKDSTHVIVSGGVLNAH